MQTRPPHAVTRAFWRFALRFNPFIFIGLLPLTLGETVFDMTGFFQRASIRELVLTALADGCFVAVTAYVTAGWSLTSGGVRRRPSLGARLQLAAMGFACGALTIWMGYSHDVILFATALTLLAVVAHVAVFLRTVTAILTPNRYPTWSEVRELLTTYLSLLTAFTLFNISLEALSPHVTAFRFAENSNIIVEGFYFTIVVMTTLGFGDIVPLTPAAKVAVSLQCLMSYVMFALLVGVITRGVVTRDSDVAASSTTSSTTSSTGPPSLEPD